MKEVIVSLIPDLLKIIFVRVNPYMRFSLMSLHASNPPVVRCVYWSDQYWKRV